MRATTMALAAGSLLAMAGCDGNGVGFYVSGSAQATITDPANPTPTTTGFSFDQQTRVDPTLPANATDGFTGVCQVGPTGRTVRLTHANDTSLDLREIDITMPSWDQDTCTNCTHGTLVAHIGDSAFTGSEIRGNAAGAPGACTFDAQRNGSYGMQLAITCSGLTAVGDTRSVALVSNLTLAECDGQPTSSSP